MSIRPFRDIKRKKTKKINVGKVEVGGDAPISVQSMTNTLTTNVKETVKQINELTEAGVDIVRVSCPDKDSSLALKKIVNQVSVPIVADIHFHYKRAIEAAVSGAHCLRINPGNIGSKKRVQEILKAAKDHDCSIRIGVNAGSLEKHKATMILEIDGIKKTTSASGNGPVDATFNAIKEITNIKSRLKLYQVHAITAGTDAQGEVTVRLEDNDISSQAKGSDSDIIVASAKAYINSLNRLVFKKSRSISNEISELIIEGV